MLARHLVSMKIATGTSVFGDGCISTHADPTSTRRASLIGTPWSHQPEHSSSFTRWSTCPILGFWGSKAHKNGRFPALDANELPCKIWRR